MYNDMLWGKPSGVGNGHGITNHTTPYEIVPIFDGLEIHKSLSVVGWRTSQGDRYFSNSLDIENFRMSPSKISVNLKNGGKDFPRLSLKSQGYDVPEPRSNWSLFSSFGMIEHFGALPVLMQIPLQMIFEGRSAPYSTWALCNVTEHLKKLKQNLAFSLESREIPIHTPSKSFEYESSDGSLIKIKPRDRPGISVDASFDYSKHKRLWWCGESSFKFDTENDDPLLIASARAPSSKPWYNYFAVNFQNKFTHISSVLPKPKNGLKIGEGLDLGSELDKRVYERAITEVARHKILDFLLTCNRRNFFLAADIEMYRAGHKRHLECMLKFFTEAKFKRIN